MPRYIDADELMERLNKKKADAATQRYTEGFNDALMKFRSMLHSAPTAEVAEVKHGEWQRQNGGFFFLCSVCGKAAATKGNYCHNCGAEMKGKEKEV